MFSFGWGRGRHTNKSAGCAIVLRKRSIRQQHVCEVKPAPTDIAGRGGIIRIRSGTYDMTLIAAYYPPPINMK
eukprot:9478023-Pyramimonas_sp.AAC.1